MAPINDLFTKAGDILQKQFTTLAEMENPYLNQNEINRIGIRLSEIDLATEEQNPMYFCPASKEKLKSLESKRPLTSYWFRKQKGGSLSQRNRHDARDLLAKIDHQILQIKGGGRECLLDSALWSLDWYVSINSRRDRILTDDYMI